RIVGEANTRSDMNALVVDERARVTGIPGSPDHAVRDVAFSRRNGADCGDGINRTCRRIDPDLAALHHSRRDQIDSPGRIEAVRHETGHKVVAVVSRRDPAEPYAVVQRETPGSFPVILDEPLDVPHVRMVVRPP